MADVIDLFAGMGGIAIGFARENFSVKGYDINPLSKKIFRINRIGEGCVRDLSKGCVSGTAEIVTGGPPCRPWSCVNLTRRRCDHPDYGLLDSFFEHVLEIKPAAFLMENVLPLKSDSKFIMWIERLRESGFSTGYRTIRYSDFGAPTSRRRLIAVGFADGCSAEEFFLRLEEHRTRPKTVMDAVQQFIRVKRGDFPDHEWPELRTIEKYEQYYRTGKYGWYRLDPGRPAPSFGNVMKTYILHPLAKMNGFPLRVISVREAMSIMGFDVSFRFPERTGMSVRYQMIADTVSPVFSQVCAGVMREVLR